MLQNGNVSGSPMHSARRIIEKYQDERGLKNDDRKWLKNASSDREAHGASKYTDAECLPGSRVAA